MSPLERGLPEPSWDQELFTSGGHFMQSAAWMAVQQALGDEIVHGAGEGWRFAAVVHRGRGRSWLYAPYGPAVQDESCLGAAVAAVRDAGRELGADFVRVEPDLVVASEDVSAQRDRALIGTEAPATSAGGAPWEAALTALGAVRARPVQPRHTLVLDLRRSEAELRSDMLSGRRRSINAAGRKGISVRRTRESGEVEQFIRLIGKTGQRAGFEPHSAGYYRTLCRVLFERRAASLYLAEVGGESVAAVIAFESPATGYYAHAADDPETARQIVAAAPLAWQIVLDCRAEGRSTFDFWGVIPGDGDEHPWAGFSRFKKTFGGRMLTRPGTFDIPLRALRYRALRAARELRASRRGPAPP
jgi:lipid II:glycine glycyltransferase (peptidoglycan interpeptide bridge formation enzyme)